MLFNVIVGLIIPWFFGIFLYKKFPGILLVIFPIGALISHIINVSAHYYNYWHIRPVTRLESLSFLVYDIGLYSILAVFLIYIIHYKNIKPLVAIITLAILTTILEGIMYVIGKVVYGNGWNIYFTFFHI